QFGAPTWSRTIADTTALVLAQAHAGGPEWWNQHRGIYHLSSQGQTNWYEFTRAILDEAGIDCRVVPITSAEYPVPARRPEYSVLSSERLTARCCRLPEWREALKLCLT
ncbi:MAG: sugar nucleotide-binding protein, partial [Sphingomonadaceae bacterium]